MQDSETKTLWNHITGEAMYGPMVGRTLGPLGNVLQINVRQALTMDPNMRIAISDRAYFVDGRQLGTAPGLAAVLAARGGGARGGASGARRSGLPDPNAQLNDMFVGTLGKEDTRRPRMELGLGIWTDSTRRYYPMDRIRERGSAFIDHIDGRKILVYIDPETFAPTALFVSASTVKLENNEVHLDNGQAVRAGVLVDRQGKRQSPERPQQVFTRWYGFALTFPGAEVFGQ
jgi:hypothetical protein